jgi:hypothetical protein
MKRAFTYLLLSLFGMILLISVNVSQRRTAAAEHCQG